MTKLGSLLTVLLATACTTSSSVEDLGELVGGRADVPVIRAPLRVAGGETVEFLLRADSAFDMIAEYAPEDIEVELYASNGEATFQIFGKQPRLAVVPRGEEAYYTLLVTNRSTSPLRGTLTIAEPAPICADDVWTGWFRTLVGRVEAAAANGYMESGERSAIDAIVAARPCPAHSDAAFVTWQAAFKTTFEDARENGYLESSEQAFVDVYVGLHPLATGAAAYRSWLELFTTVINVARLNGYLETSERAFVDVEMVTRPLATGDASYVDWGQLMRPILIAAAQNGYIETSEIAFLETVIAAKPCASGPLALATWNSFAEISANGIAPILAAARPAVSCQ